MSLLLEVLDKLNWVAHHQLQGGEDLDGLITEFD
jgi:hypothetical protein